MKWETVALGEILDYEQPTNYIVDSDKYDDAYTLPVLTAGKSFILGYTNETNNIFDKGPVIIFDDFTTAFKFVDFPFKVKSSAMKILKAKKERADIKFLYYQMLLTKVDTQLHKRYWISKYSKLKIPLPPLPVQKKIAAILDAADAYRQKTKALIEKYDELAQSLFLDMFGDPVKNEKGWIIQCLDKYCEIISGYPFKSKNYQISGIPICGGLIIMPNYIDWSKSKYWSKEETDGLEDYFLKENDIVIAMDRPWINSGFKIGIIDKDDLPSLLIQRTARVRCYNIPYYYVYYNLKSQAFKYHCVPTETTVPHITLREIRKFQIPIPPNEMMIQFDKMIRIINKQRVFALSSLTKAEELFQSLLQRAFKGELIKEVNQKN